MDTKSTHRICGHDRSLVVILASACAVALLTRVGLPAALGYLLAGLAIRPHGLQLVALTDETRFLAELGVIFLMFMVGLEFSLPTTIAARAHVFGAGSLQVGLTSLISAGGAMLAGADWRTAVLLGGAVAMSSTAMALKQLAEQGEITSQHGRLALGVLLFQDLATLPLLVAVGAWQEGGEPDALGVLRQLAVAAVALGGAAIVRMALSWVARAKWADLFLLSVLLLALGTAFAAPRRHRCADRPVSGRDGHRGKRFPPSGRGRYSAFSRRSVGAVLCYRRHGSESVDRRRLPLGALAWTIAFLPGKALVMVIVAAIMRPAQAGVRIAVILAHGGEFGLLLLTRAMAAGVVDPQVGQPALLL